MKLESQVTSLELSKKLKELGVRQESVFYWHDNEVGAHDAMFSVREWGGASCAAFTVAELGEIMRDGDYDMPVLRGDPGRYLAPRGLNADINEHAEADARAKMLIYLLENKLMTV